MLADSDDECDLSDPGHSADGASAYSRSPSTFTSYGEIIQPTLDRTHGRPASYAGESSHPSSGRAPSAPTQPTTLDDVRERAVLGMCFRAVRTAATVDGTTIGVVNTLSPSADAGFLTQIAAGLHRHFPASATITSPFSSSSGAGAGTGAGGGYIFAVCPGSGPLHPGTAPPLLLCGAPATLVTRAATLAAAKFAGRVAVAPAPTHPGGTGTLWLAHVRDLGATAYDAAALHAALRQAARAPADPARPPQGALGAHQLLARARAGLERLGAAEAYAALRDPHALSPAVLVDIRPQAVRAREGALAGALVVERNVLEWRFDPRLEPMHEGKDAGGEGEGRLAVADRYDLRVIVLDTDGSASSLAAASLRALGLLTATDVVGGYRAWRAAGLPAEVQVLATGVPLDALR